MGVQSLGQDHAVPQDRAVFFQIGFPQSAVLAQGLVALVGQAQVGDLVISVLTVS